MSSTANSSIRDCRLFRGTKSSAPSKRADPASPPSPSASASAFPGWAERATPATIAAPVAKICATARSFTGYTRDGGFASHATANVDYAFRLPDSMNDRDAAPLLCAGLIGWRCLAKAGQSRTLGLYGFGAAAHLIAQVARWQGRDVFAFTRPGDTTAQTLAKELGCVWAGGSDETPPIPLDAAIIFAPVGALVPVALRAVKKGGRVVCGGIHMSDIPQFPYRLLWEEREICSVANLTRADAQDFLTLAAKIPLQVKTTAYPLEKANEALDDLREGRLTGAAVLIP